MAKTTIKEIGELVKDFKQESMLVLFGTLAPPELKDISVIHEPLDTTETNIIKTNGSVQIGAQIYTITKVGSDANTSFDQLGHITILFTDNDIDILPGSISVSPATFPNLIVGESIEFK